MLRKGPDRYPPGSRAQVGSPDAAGPYSFRGRVLLLGGFWGVSLLLLGLRACYLQVWQHEALLERGDDQSRRSQVIEGRRGPIHDRRERLLATSVRRLSLHAYPLQIEDRERTASALAPLLEQDAASIAERLGRSTAFAWIARRLPPQTAEAIAALRLPGLGFTEEYLRVYPLGSLAGAVLGFAGIDDQGLEGVEGAYEFVLGRTRQRRLVEVDARGDYVWRNVADSSPPGGRLQLTLDAAIQYVSETALREAVQRSQAKSGVVVTLHTPTAEILAVAQVPPFDPNHFSRHAATYAINRAVNNGYEPGSTFKLITLAAALESGRLNPENTFDCEQGSWKHYDSEIHDTRPHGQLNLRQILRVSSNICAAKVGLALTAEELHAAIERFGFGRRSGLFLDDSGRRLASEATGSLRRPRDWTPVDHAAIAFGHGVLVSPLQMAAAVNAIAADGVWRAPRLIRGAWNAEDEPIDLAEHRPPARQVIAPQTAELLKSFMEDAVLHGTGKRAQIKGYRLAGKTGTTEKFDIEARGYSKTRQIASFVGFAPLEEPQLTVLVLIEEPVSPRSGGMLAAPVFRQIILRGLPLLAVWPQITRETGRSPPADQTSLAVLSSQIAPGLLDGPAVDSSR